ncbi:MAG: hypothetical protein DKM50_08545 [Candidatus Margulisiibacteriota bacterium]|nr:MAG: hypothetical protein DKM50_08545 [Candidatus Margulisiibacteriota bacterium]HCY37828.1 hypothetical protein [Candidatus Margulisiibacteriota bacterium]
MELLEYWGFFLRRKTVIISIFLLVVIMGILYLSMAKPVYEADCALLVTETKGPGLLGDLEVGALLSETIGKSDPIDTQLELVKRRPILSKVIRDTKLVDGRGNPLKIRALREAINVQAINNTNLISISYRDHDPIVAREVVNTVALTFAEQNQKLNKEEISSARVFIENQLRTQKEKVIGAENSVLDFKRKLQTVALEQETTTQLEGLSLVEATKMDLETKLKGSYAQKQQLESKINGKIAQSSPFYSLWMKSLEDTNNEITNLTAQLANITSEIARITVDLNKLPPKEIELARIVRDEKLASEVYTRLLGRYEEARINEAGKVANVKIIEPAITPDEPVSPNLKKVILLTLLLGLIAGISVAYLIEYIDDVPGSVEVVKNILPYNTLGMLPNQSNINPLFMINDPRSPLAEAVRLIYTNLKFKEIMGKRCITMLVTSALAGEGKTTLSSNLAISLTNMGKKVVMVDIDLRRSRLNKVFNMPGNKGVTDYLIGDVEIEDIVVIDPVSGVYIVTAGVIPPNPAELLAGKKIQELITRLREKFDIVMLDSPPITLVSETLDFARTVDGIIITVDMKNTSLRAIQGMQELLKDKHLPILGMVFNKLSVENAGYAYCSYKYKYSY